MMGIRIVIPDARISMDPLKAYTYSYLPLASNMKPIINKYKAELDYICTITNSSRLVVQTANVPGRQASQSIAETTILISLTVGG